jgi:nitronate monooxygenase
MFALADLDVPIVGAPLAGGPATVELAAAVCEAGGLGSLAGALRTPEQLEADIAAMRERTSRPFAVNVFEAQRRAGDPDEVARYAQALTAEGRSLGEARHDDDRLREKLALLVEARPAVVSFTFGCPARPTIDRLRAAGCAVWVTVTTPEEAVFAAGLGADALVVQGVEAGGHRGGFDDDAPGDYGLLALLQLVDAAVEVPLVAAGGIMTGRAVAAVLAAGAAAAQLGSALLRTPEAGTSAPHREALAAGDRPTGLTRAFSGRLARGIVNRFQREHADAPSAYPEVHHLTTPMRAAARAEGDAESINLWAGQAYPLAREAPAAQIVRDLAAEAQARLRELAGG